MNFKIIQQVEIVPELIPLYLEELKHYFGHETPDCKVEIFSQNDVETDKPCIFVRIKGLNMIIVQARSAPIMKYLALLDVGNRLVQEKHWESFKLKHEEGTTILENQDGEQVNFANLMHPLN